MQEFLFDSFFVVFISMLRFLIFVLCIYFIKFLNIFVVDDLMSFSVNFNICVNSGVVLSSYPPH